MQILCNKKITFKSYGSVEFIESEDIDDIEIRQGEDIILVPRNKARKISEALDHWLDEINVH